MKLPISWLKEYIAVSLPAERLADALTMSGTKVERITNKNGETVLEIEITTNRPDCLSILGLARETSVLTGKKIKWPEFSKSRPAGGKKPAIRVLDKKGCPLYTARLIENVSIAPSPQKIQKFLELAGARAINNAVDATNFVLFETGQPLHAFDYDKIKGGAIIVRRARAGEKFLGIDGSEYTLDDKILVIADAERPIAIAGVIGGRFTEVTPHTKNILLESAYFDPHAVRRASRFVKVSTDSSYRFERGVDRGNVTAASARARDLILRWAGGAENGNNFQEIKEKRKHSKITLRKDRIEKLLGMPVKPSRVSSILKSLGLSARAAGAGRWLVAPASERRDIAQEADLIEEILRIEGFEKIPSIIPPTHHSAHRLARDRTTRLLELRKFVSGLGFREIISYSFLSEKEILDSSLPLEGENRPHRLVNALSGELQYFRPSLLPGMLQSVVFNIHRKASSLKLFEVGSRYCNGREETALSLCLYGHFEENWLRKSPSSFFDLKGALERVFKHIGLETYEWKENTSCSKYAASSLVHSDGKKLGTLGILSVKVLGNWDIPHDVIYLEIALDEALDKARRRGGSKPTPIPKFPAVRRDIAFVVGQKTSVQALEGSILKAGAPYLKAVELFDQYIGKNIAKGKRSLAFSLCYQKESGTFTDEEINSLQARVGEVLKNEHRVEFR